MSSPPLAGATLAISGPAAVAAIASAEMRALGATIDRARPAGQAVLAGSVDAALDAGLPPGTIERAAGLALAGAAVLSLLTGETVTADADAAAATVLLPLIVDEAVRARPSQPRPAPGGGWLCADLGAPGDEEAFERLLTTLGPRCDARAVEAAAQEWRLPVVAYRERPRRRAAGSAGRGAPAPPAASRAGGGGAPLAGLEVVDLSAMWAGPLAAWLLAALGATVTTVEARVRPDGMRGQPGTFAALDRGKHRIALDLRDGDAHRELVSRARQADVLLDSFSPRVMPNLGLARQQLVEAAHPLVAVSVTAFPAASPEEGWVAYGTGAHAHCGLGDLGGRFREPAVSYPDPLAGLAAFLAALAGLAGRGNAGGGHRRVSLVSAAAPLACHRGDPATIADPAEPGAAALTARLRARRWLDDCGRPHHPFVIGGAR